MNSLKEKIVFVCQRYGMEVNGGAEAECRMYAERMTPFYEVEVVTTCALDYVTWDNEYPAGVSNLNGVTVLRFPTVRSRNQKNFDKATAAVLRPDHTDAEEKKWLEEQGPVAPEALRYLREHGKEYKAVIFMTYLYYLSARGLLDDCGRTVLIPTAHDEWPIYLRCFQPVYQRAEKFIYNAWAEKAFVEKLFPATVGKPGVVVGSGVVYPQGELPDVKEHFGIEGPYICYSGRIDESKGCGMLFRYFEEYKKRRGGELKLVLTGKAVMPVPQRADVFSLGFVSEEEKYAVMRGAEAFVLASQFESLSIVVLESMMMGRPVLVNGKCEVLKDHCTHRNAGLYLTKSAEFVATLTYLLPHPEAYRQMCENGKRYVQENYRWDTIVEKIHGLIEDGAET